MEVLIVIFPLLDDNLWEKISDLLQIKNIPVITYYPDEEVLMIYELDVLRNRNLQQKFKQLNWKQSHHKNTSHGKLTFYKMTSEFEVFLKLKFAVEEMCIIKL